MGAAGACGDFAGIVSSLTLGMSDCIDDICGGGGGADFLRTRNTWLHEVHFTVTPLSGTRASSNSYSVLQRGQLTSMSSEKTYSEIRQRAAISRRPGN